MRGADPSGHREHRRRDTITRAPRASRRYRCHGNRSTERSRRCDRRGIRAPGSPRERCRGHGAPTRPHDVGGVLRNGFALQRHVSLLAHADGRTQDGRDSRRGGVVNISSRSADMVQKAFVAYGAGKAALNMVTQNMAAEFGPRCASMRSGWEGSPATDSTWSSPMTRCGSSSTRIRPWRAPALRKTSPPAPSTWPRPPQGGSRARSSRGWGRRWTCDHRANPTSLARITEGP